MPKCYLQYQNHSQHQCMPHSTATNKLWLCCLLPPPGPAASAAMNAEVPSATAGGHSECQCMPQSTATNKLWLCCLQPPKDLPLLLLRMLKCYLQHQDHSECQCMPQRTATNELWLCSAVLRMLCAASPGPATSAVVNAETLSATAGGPCSLCKFCCAEQVGVSMCCPCLAETCHFSCYKSGNPICQIRLHSA